MAENVFDEAFATKPFSLIKIVRYPGESNPNPKQGVGAHRGGGVLTLLLVEPGKGGLQVEHDGDWIDVPSVPGALVVNIREMLELATGRYLKATLHRVMSPQIGSDRISIPFVFNPALDTIMPQLDLNSELAAEARGSSVDLNSSPILDTYGNNALPTGCARTRTSLPCSTPTCSDVGRQSDAHRARVGPLWCEAAPVPDSGRRISVPGKRQGRLRGVVCLAWVLLVVSGGWRLSGPRRWENRKASRTALHGRPSLLLVPARRKQNTQEPDEY